MINGYFNTSVEKNAVLTSTLYLYTMRLRYFKNTQRLPVSIEQAWDFFSSPANLKAITPASEGFEITSADADARMHPGMIISYLVSPLPGIRMEWVTEITHMVAYSHFVDEQRFGPFGFWHHKHCFKAIDGGVEMTDIVHYKVPYGFIGSIAHALFVRKRLEAVFKYRNTQLAAIFGSM